MANPFRQFTLSFESANQSVAGFPGPLILDVLDGFIDTDSADMEVGNKKLHVRIVTILTEEQILKICDEVKKSLEKTGDDRLIYKVETISL